MIRLSFFAVVAAALCTAPAAAQFVAPPPAGVTLTPPPPAPPPPPRVDVPVVPRLDETARVRGVPRVPQLGEQTPVQRNSRGRRSFGDRVTRCLQEGAAAGLGLNDRAAYSRACANR